MTQDGFGKRPGEEDGNAQNDARLEKQLDELFERLEVEPAPSSLTRRLHRIPLEETGPEPWWRRLLPATNAPRWMLLPALVAALLAVGVVLLQPSRPSRAEVLQARHDLAVAFGYIDRAGVLAGQEIHDVLGDELRRTVKGNLSKHIPFTEQFRKEKTS